MSQTAPQSSPSAALAALDQLYAYYTPMPVRVPKAQGSVDYFDYAAAA